MAEADAAWLHSGGGSGLGNLVLSARWPVEQSAWDFGGSSSATACKRCAQRKNMGLRHDGSGGCTVGDGAPMGRLPLLKGITGLGQNKNSSSGGGGAGAVGNAATAGGSPPKYINAGPGGAGVVSHITGSPVARAGGGGGGGNDGDGSGQSGAQATGGSGGGGNGGYYPSTSGANGTANTGGGGGAAGATSPTGNTAGPSGAGGSGIVILRYQFQ